MIIPVTWSDPNPPGVVDEFILEGRAIAEGQIFIVRLLGNPTPDVEGKYHANVDVPFPIWVSLRARDGEQLSPSSNTRFLPEPGVTGLPLGMLFLAWLTRGRVRL